MEFCVVIPARYGSTRLPRKALRVIAGKPLIQHVFERARTSSARRIVIATDHPEIAACVTAFGAEVVLTSTAHQSGSERVAEVVEKLHWPDDTLVVNIQGDEPCLWPSLIDQAASALAGQTQALMASLYEPLPSIDMLHNPHVIKVVLNRESHALYFSRAPIPWRADHGLVDQNVHFYQRHIGVYAYRVGFLKRYVAWPRCVLEQWEALEQLRVLWYGEKIIMGQASCSPGPGVDLEEHLEISEKWLKNNKLI